MRLKVRVLHNVSRDMFFRYDPKTSKLYHAHDFEVTADNVEQAANLVWLLANVAGPDDLALTDAWAYGEQVEAYRRRMNRSLSVSDVLLFYEGERFAGARAVVAVGHDALSTEPKFVDGDNSTEASASFKAHQEFHTAFKKE